MKERKPIYDSKLLFYAVKKTVKTNNFIELGFCLRIMMLHNNFITYIGNHSRICLLWIVLLFILGCEEEGNILGTWQGKQYVRDPRVETAHSHIVGDIELRIFEEGNYSLVEVGVPSSGKWVQQNKKYILKPDYILGKHVDYFGEEDRFYKVPIKLKFKAENEIIFYRPALKTARIHLRKNYIPAMRTVDALEKLHADY